MRFKAIMNNQSEHQTQQSNQFFHCQKVVSKPEQLICTTEVNIPHKAVKFDPTAFTNTLHELTLLILALTKLGKVVLPLISLKVQKKMPSKSQEKVDKKS